MHHLRRSYGLFFVLAAAPLAGCATGGAPYDDGDVTVDPTGNGAGSTADAAAEDSASSPGSTRDASTPLAQPDAAPSGYDSGFPPPTGVDSGSPAYYDAGSPSYYDSGSGQRDSGSTQSGCAPPDTSASCTACMTSGQTCQLNGCYNGYYCDDATSKCHPAASCP